MIRWSRIALSQIQSIHRQIASDQPEAAIEQVSLILHAIDQVDKFPHSGKAGKDFNNRELVVPATPYILYYRLEKDAITLRGIRHGAREQRPRIR